MCVVLCSALGACSSDDGASPSPAAARTPRDAAGDGLFRDFLDGKYDGKGHPIGASVWQAESECKATIGSLEAEGRRLSRGDDGAGSACSAEVASLGLGRFDLNVRALVFDTRAADTADANKTVLHLAARDESGALLGEKDVPWSAFPTALTYTNVFLSFTHGTNARVKLEVTWPAEVDARLDYVELFRENRDLLLEPGSALAQTGASLQVEALAPPAGFELQVSCDAQDKTAEANALLAAGTATREDTEFRSAFTFPEEALLAGCSLPSRLRFRIGGPVSTQTTARVTRYAEEPPCTFGTETTRVLLTGFEPFPAWAEHDNSSDAAVKSFDPSAVPGISVMKLTLPVEFDTAAAIVESAIKRCDPDVVIGFGQGRSQVDVETTAYNLKDSAEIAGGIPDNRGRIPSAEPISSSGAAELTTGLPAAEILAALGADGITAGTSDDPGRYVCNNVFYRIMTSAAGTKRVSGFVHLPYVHTVGTAEQAELRSVVTHAVVAAVKKRLAN